MAYRDNVSALAAKLHISNDPSLREEDIKICELVFISFDMGIITHIQGTAMNRGSRLFFQSLSDGPKKGDMMELEPELRQKAQEYFAELWEPNPEPGKRPLLDALRYPRHVSVELVWKREAFSQEERDEDDRLHGQR